MEIQPYARQFQSDLYRICLETGDAGADATGLIEPELLGHFYAGPYAELEPELCFVVVSAASAVGYILGTRDSVGFAAAAERSWWPPLRRRYPMPPDDDQSRSAALIRSLHRGYQAPECAAQYPAHLHIDLLPEAQKRGFGAQLMERFCAAAGHLGAHGVHLEVGRANSNAVAFYRHIGLQVITETAHTIVFGRRL